jgi:hypothetical protein
MRTKFQTVKSDGKRQFGRSRRKWKDNTTVDNYSELDESCPSFHVLFKAGRGLL